MSGPSTESSAVDSARMLEDAHTLAYPRFPGTEGDRRAIAWLSERLRHIGLDVEEQWFDYDMRPAWTALRALLAGAGLLMGVAGWLAGEHPAVATAFTALALAGGGVFLAWAPGLEKLYRRPGPTRTANVIARRSAPAGERPPRLTLVLLAHHDSKSQNLPLPARAGLTILALLGSLGLTGALAAQLVGREVDSRLALGCGLAAASALLALSTLKSGNRSPGGVDNAGSVAILLELARHLPTDLPPDVDLIFLSPGAEEDHMVGAMRWLDRYAEDLSNRPLYALNFDGAGIPGRLALLERFGFGRPFSPTLSRIARECAGRLAIPVRGVFLPPAMGVDAIPFAHRGIDCLTIASGSLGRATFAVHSAGDVADHLSPEALEEAARLGWAMARELAAAASRHRAGASPAPT